MNGLEEIDWETVVDFAKRFGGVVIFLLFMLAGRRRNKGRRKQTEPESQPVAKEVPVSVPAIEPGDDATKLASRYSSGDSG